MEHRPELLHWAWVASLVGGLLLVLGPIATVFTAHLGGPVGPAAEPWPWSLRALTFGALWSVVAGVVVLVGAQRFRERLADATGAGRSTVLHWGIAVVVAGALALGGVGGLGVGPIAAVAGGALAILGAGRPEPAAP